MKHAYCIIAHSDLYCLQKLISCLDDPRNDIFIHFDNKSNLFDENIDARYSNLYILPKEKSKDIRWGAYSLVEAEIEILMLAKSKNNYAYYHLLSGQDLPIKSQDWIYHFFSRLPEGTNLIGFKDYTDKDRRNMLKRVVPFHLFKNNLRSHNKLIKICCRSIEEISSHIQRILGMRISHDVEYRKGCNWVSITDEFTDYLLSKRNFIRTIFEKSILCDELFVQTIAWNSSFRSTIYNYDEEYNGCMREIDWNRGNPYIWKENDFEHLIKSDKLFARKFSSTIDKRIINRIVNFVKYEQF